MFWTKMPKMITPEVRKTVSYMVEWADLTRQSFVTSALYTWMSPRTPVELSVKPSFGNLLVWKTIYRNDATYYVDAVRVGYQPTIFEGASIQGLEIERDFPWLSLESQQARDVERFRWFSKGYLAKEPSNPYGIIDLRYSLLPNEINGLWSITLSPTAPKDAHVDFITTRQVGPEHRKKLWQMIIWPVLQK